MILTNHDSIMVEAPAARASEVAELLKAEMERPLTGFTVPIKAEVKIGPNWAPLTP